ncbi:MAG TPA: DnaB-like helicase N-terminal domain-containing protein, partial [Streptomyces sp.]|nr:DnaB-like helicase N-terminal domain-containing protein [Streptomyces sp.]
MTQQPEHVEDHWVADPNPDDRAAVAHQRRRETSPDQGRRGHDDGPWQPVNAFERVPPQDLEAEQSVLGGMLLSKDAIADVVEVLKGQDFYRPAHETVYQAVLDLYAKGEPADPITVAAELTRRGELARAGGPGYLHSLVQKVPTAANAEYYAEIVHERAVLRRLVEAGTRITQMGYAADGDVDEIVNSAQAEIYAVTEARTSEDYLPLAEIMEGALDEIEAIGSRSGQMTGVPTGFTDLDSLTNGLHPGQMIVVAARPAMGKALALDTPLPTPDGWTTMGEVREGDLLLDADGRPTSVVAATDVMHDRPCYRITFDDGTSVIADAEHQWLTDTRASRRSAQQATVKTTKEIAETVRCPTTDRRMNHSVRNAAPLDLPERGLPIPPYTLGAWLGDGAADAARFTTADPELLEYLREDGVRARPVGTAKTAYALSLAASAPGGRARGSTSPAPHAVCVDCGNTCFSPFAEPRCDRCTRRHGSLLVLLRDAGVLGNKHIPQEYLRASTAQRRALLAGLLDTDGTVNRTGSVQFAVTNRALADGFRELVHGLGYRCGTWTKRVRGRTEESSTCYIVTFTTDDQVFRLSRKQQA